MGDGNREKLNRCSILRFLRLRRRGDIDYPTGVCSKTHRRTDLRCGPTQPVVIQPNPQDRISERIAALLAPQTKDRDVEVVKATPQDRVR